MWIWSIAYRRGEQRSEVQPGMGGTFDGAEPAQVGVKVLGRDTTELAHPALQPGVPIEPSLESVGHR